MLYGDGHVATLKMKEIPDLNFSSWVGPVWNPYYPGSPNY